MGTACYPKIPPIVKNKLLIVEGADELQFFEELLGHLSLDVQVISFEGKDNYSAKYHALCNDNNFENVSVIGIIRDADDSAENAFKSIVGILDKMKHPTPEKPGSYTCSGGRNVGVYILPGASSSGMLEDLFLSTVAAHPVTECVDAYMSCLASKLEKREKNSPRKIGKEYFPAIPAKAKAQAFLAGKHDIAKDVGVAARKGYWNFDHDSLNAIKEFLLVFGR